MPPMAKACLSDKVSLNSLKQLNCTGVRVQGSALWKTCVAGRTIVNRGLLSVRACVQPTQVRQADRRLSLLLLPVLAQQCNPQRLAVRGRHSA